jgi:hypothetical protein
MGQTPVMRKIRDMFYLQVSGLAAKSDWSDEQLSAEVKRACTGRRILLYLDDIWEEAHIAELSVCDPSCGSVLLISTRMRGLCRKHALEIRPPTEEEGVQILMDAANMPSGSTPPKDAAEIVRLCGFLPLSLSMAGKLIADLGIGDDWHGVTDVLEDELHNSQHSSSEQRMIRASLAALGDSQDSHNVRALFKLFALVPEVSLGYPLAYRCVGVGYPLALSRYAANLHSGMPIQFSGYHVSSVDFGDHVRCSGGVTVRMVESTKPQFTLWRKPFNPDSPAAGPSAPLVPATPAPP